MEQILRDRINTILVRAFKEDWSDYTFSKMKAHICAELSAVVYWDVQEHEIKKASRIHLFASDTYRKIINSGKMYDALKFLTEGNFEAKFFVIRGRYAVILGTILNDVVILAVRGTVFRRLWDWKANVDAAKYNVNEFPYYLSFENQYFHRGFFESIIPHFRSIADEIRKHIKNSEPIIVWTGHSLGGAMAAIGNAISSTRNIYMSPWKDFSYINGGAYTFGMPRYGGLGAICGFDGPYHIYKKRDLVPTVPLRSMGFSDCAREYLLDESGLVAPTERTDTFGLAGHVPKLISSIKAHSIEGYADSLSKTVHLPRP